MGQYKEQKSNRRPAGRGLSHYPFQNLVVAHGYGNASPQSRIVGDVALGPHSSQHPGPLTFGGLTTVVGLIHINTRAQRKLHSEWTHCALVSSLREMKQVSLTLRLMPFAARMRDTEDADSDMSVLGKASARATKSETSFTYTSGH